MLSRKEIAQKIINAPQDFKICEACESIVVANVVLCPNCHAYRFNQNEADIIHHAEILGSREQTSVTAEDLT